MRLGHLISLLLHAGLVAVVMIGAPDLMRRPDEVQFIPFELISEAEIAERTNVPDEPEEEPAAAPEPAVEEPEAPTETLAAPAEEETQQTLSDEPIPQSAPDPEPVPAETDDNPIEPEKVEEIRPRVKPKPQPEEPEEQDSLDFDALSAVINREKENEQQSAPRQAPQNAPDANAEAAGEGVGVSGRLTATEKDLLRAKLVDCWNVKAILGSPGAEKLKVILFIKLNEDGTLDGQPKVVNKLEIDLSGNAFWKNAEREAIAAVYKCEPYNYLSPERYEQWRELEFNFDPKDLLGL
ncbi:MAG: hypothetical protein AAFR11_08275 [Pseudomonadota bacterium]